MDFKLVSPFKPTGDQPQAIDALVAGLKKNHRDQTLLGVTGSGKTFTMANVIAKVRRPTLIISPNKTLAAQLASEFREFFPNNSVNYFVSYYDYYQPEAYLPRTDTYIEKETDINEEIDRLRHAATTDLLTRRDVIVVASVSCIYGLGSPERYQAVSLHLAVGGSLPRRVLLRQLATMRYGRNDIDFKRGTYRVKGELIEIFPAFSQNDALRLTFLGDELEGLRTFDTLTGQVTGELRETYIYPASHYVGRPDDTGAIFKQIRADLAAQLTKFKDGGHLLFAERLEQRVHYDLEMMTETGYTTGIENYSRYFDGRKPGEPAFTLIDYFPKDFLLFIDESHITVPQIGGMYAGDHSRKETLINYGFRLPAAYDNRPLKFSEFDSKIKNVVYVSATPSDFERGKSVQVVEQIIRPTGLVDPTITVRPTTNQIDDLLAEINLRVKKHQRVLVTTLTKRMAEDLSEYFAEAGVKVHYLHSEVETMERLEILRDLRLGIYDVVVGINLLREGLDLPEVSLVAILDADKEGYLRSKTALIQVMGRAARHVEGSIIMYADRVTGSMRDAMSEIDRRRKLQTAYNAQHGITPKTIEKKIGEERLAGAHRVEAEVPTVDPLTIPPDEVSRLIKDYERQMDLAAKNLEFEKAALLRDQIKHVRAAVQRPSKQRK